MSALLPCYRANQERISLSASSYNASNLLPGSPLVPCLLYVQRRRETGVLVSNSVNEDGKMLALLRLRSGTDIILLMYSVMGLDSWERLLK